MKKHSGYQVGPVYVIGKLPGDAIILPTNEGRGQLLMSRGDPYPRRVGPLSSRRAPKTIVQARCDHAKKAFRETTNRRKSCIASNKEGLADERTTLPPFAQPLESQPRSGAPKGGRAGPPVVPN